MEKDAIFNHRKELKQRSHQVLRGHYVVLIFLMLVMTVFGTEYSFSTMNWEGNPFESIENKDDPGNVLSADSVLDYILRGRLDEGARIADKKAEEMINEKDTPSFLGRTEGVLASLVNSVTSGRLAIQLGKTLRTITHSDVGAAVVYTLGAFLWYALIFFFLKNVYSAVMRRIYLEARVYGRVHFMDVLHFAAVRKWIRACWVMFVKYVYEVLWSLTIVGGIIKGYSYFAVPYIVAENPDVTPKQAITLSRKMMDGHKLELFKYDVTMLGWVILGVVTFGISDLLYGAAYRLTCRGEFYAKIREEALAKGLEGTEILNDRYLFEKADRILLTETYFDVVDEITVIHENKTVLTGFKAKVAEWFGIWLGSLSEKKRYDDQEGRKYEIERYKLSMEGNAYPQWLNPLWRRKELQKHGSFSFLRSYTIWTLFLLFLVFSFAGWSWEVALHYMQTGQFANRGTLHGPWLPIYGTGCSVVLILCSRFRKKPVLEFITSIILCGLIEYMSGWLLEVRYHQRWWSYDGYFLNLHGRVCAEGLLVFGVGCCVIVYLLAPLFDFLLSKIRQKVLIGICVVLAVLFFGDSIYSSINPNMAEGAVESVETEDGEDKKEVPELPAITEEETPAEEEPAGEETEPTEAPSGEEADPGLVKL